MTTWKKLRIDVKFTLQRLENIWFFSNFVDCVEWKLKHRSTNLSLAKTWNPRKTIDSNWMCNCGKGVEYQKGYIPLKFACLCREDANALAWLRKLKMRNWCTWMVLKHVCNMCAVFIKWDGFSCFSQDDVRNWHQTLFQGLLGGWFFIQTQCPQ